MRTLVIGATGYVGSAVSKRLLSGGGEVIGLARSPASAAKLAAAGLQILPGDVADARTILPALAGVNAVIFAPQVDMSTERAAVELLLTALEGSEKPFIFTSGTGVLGIRTNGDWSEQSFAEDEPFVKSTYIAPRCDTEDLVRAAAARGIKGIVIRPPLIWGHGRCPPLSALHASARSGAVCYLGRGLNLYSSIHVDDLAEIFTLALERGVAGALYHAVSGEMGWRAMAEEIGRVRSLPTRSIDYLAAKNIFGPFLTPVVFAVSSRTRCPRTRRELGWEPSPERLDIYTELSHPAFMADEDNDFTLADALLRRQGKNNAARPSEKKA